MAIIYTYPTKATPNDNDLLLISDSQDNNSTKKIKISSLPGGSGVGVSSVSSANAAITVTSPTSTAVLTSVAYSGGANIGHVPTGGSASTFLRGDGTWVTPTDLGLTSVALAVPAALSVSGSPLTSNGTITISGAGATSQFIDGTGALQTNSLNNLTDATIDGTSSYIVNIPSGLSGNPAGNTILGSGAGNSLTTGNSNVAVGKDAGNVITTGDGNILLGNNADASALGDNYAIAIGDGATSGQGGIALGRNATAGAAELAIGNITLDATAITNQPTHLPIKINGVQYYLKLYNIP